MSFNGKHRFIENALEKRKRNHRFRTLASYQPSGAISLESGGRELINFSGNDYLGLSKHPRVVERSKQYADEYGAGSTASRLINGTFDIHDQLEKKLADTFGWESALIFNSGFQANSTIISTLADRHSLILADKLSHNSLLQGSLSSRATFRRFEHNDVSDLEEQLKRANGDQYSRVIVITESIFSMDGDRSKLEPIAELSQQYGAWLFVDEAHAVGLWGKHGLGLTQDISGIDMVLGTCGKAFGGFGAFLLCSDRMRDFMINFCPGFIYTTALPPAVIGAIEASLELIPEMDEERKQLHEKVQYMKEGIHKAGLSTGASESQIIPIVIGEDEETLKLANSLKNQGFLATAIRPPTVPKGSARLRITLSSEHKKLQMKKFLTALTNRNNG